jgi:hypothetical protein
MELNISVHLLVLIHLFFSEENLMILKSVEMIWSLTRLELLTFYRLSVWLPTGPESGLIFFRRRSGRLWILDASVWRWLLGLSTTRVVGGFLKDYMMHE